MSLQYTRCHYVDLLKYKHKNFSTNNPIKHLITIELKTNSGRQRLNLHGAINAETHEVSIIDSQTINKDSTLELLIMIEQKYPFASEIKVILDNARYHYSKEVTEYIANSRIDLIFLPTYSPNLNLIERLWHFFKKKLLYNTYYKNVLAFKKACIKFFKNLNKYKDEISNFMDADFHIA